MGHSRAHLSCSTDEALRIPATALTAGLQASSAAYDARFESTFGLSNKGYTSAEVDFAKSLTSSMIGGIGYFYGSSIVDRNFRHEYDEEEDEDDDEQIVGKRELRPEFVPPMELYTATPSRSFFPRGFYWDEGFHLMLIGAWDNDLR